MILRNATKKEVRLMTYSYSGSIEFRTLFDTHTYRTLSFRNTRAQTIPRNDQIYIDWSFAESTIKRNARSSAEVEREIVKAIEDTYFADLTRHEDFEPFIVNVAKQHDYNVSTSVKSYSSEQHYHEIYYVIDVELSCDEDIEDDIESILTDAFNDFLRQFNYDCNTVLETNFEMEFYDVESYDDDEGITYIDFAVKTDLSINFAPEDALNSVTCTACTFATDEF